MLTPHVGTGVAISRQRKILETIRGNPLGSYIFSGAPAVGKTTLMRELESLARAACPKNFAIYSKTAAQYQSDVTAVARGEFVSGLIKPSSFAASAYGIRWGLFLDDVDKVSASEFIRLQLFELLNAACEQRTPSSQLVMTTNMTKVEFKKFFGDAVYWRVSAKCVWVSIQREEEAA